MSSLALRHVRRLSTAAVSTPLFTSSRKYRNLIIETSDPDEALKIYEDFISKNSPSTSPVSTRYAQEFTVRRLSKAGRISDIESFLESHKSKPQITDETFLSSLIRSYSIAGMFENALKTYQQMEELGTPRSSFSFNCLLSACVNCKFADRVPVYFNEFPVKYGFSPDSVSYGILIKAYCEIKLVDVAMKKLSEMVDKGFEVNVIVFTTILHSLYENGMKDEAEKFWYEMVMKKGVKPDLGAYNVRLLQHQDGELTDIKLLLKEMCRAGVKPDAISYTYLISCLCKKGMIDEAEKVYTKLLSADGTNLNASSFNTMISYICNQDKYLEGYKFFKDSVKKRKIPKFNTLKVLIEGLVKNGHESEAKTMISIVYKKFRSYKLKEWQKLVVDLGFADIEVKSDSSEKAQKSEDEIIVKNFPTRLFKDWR